MFVFIYLTQAHVSALKHHVSNQNKIRSQALRKKSPNEKSFEKQSFARYISHLGPLVFLIKNPTYYANTSVCHICHPSLHIRHHNPSPLPENGSTRSPQQQQQQQILQKRSYLHSICVALYSRHVLFAMRWCLLMHVCVCGRNICLCNGLYMSSLDKASGSDPVLVVTQLSGHSRISDTKTDSLLIYNILVTHMVIFAGTGTWDSWQKYRHKYYYINVYESILPAGLMHVRQAAFPLPTLNMWSVHPSASDLHICTSFMDALASPHKLPSGSRLRRVLCANNWLGMQYVDRGVCLYVCVCGRTEWMVCVYTGHSHLAVVMREEDVRRNVCRVCFF